MNVAETSEFVVGLLRNQYDGRWAEIMPGVSAWSLRRDHVLSILHVLESDDAALLSITAGLCCDAIWSPDAVTRCNAENQQLMFGRVFVDGNPEQGTCYFLMQEFLGTHALAWDQQGLISWIMTLVASVTGRAEALAPALISDFGGRPFADSEAVVLAMLG